jgi:hypothetical protein
VIFEEGPSEKVDRRVDECRNRRGAAGPGCCHCGRRSYDMSPHSPLLA